MVSDLEHTSHGCEFEWQTGTNWCGCFNLLLSFSLSLRLRKKMLPRFRRFDELASSSFSNPGEVGPADVVVMRMACASLAAVPAVTDALPMAAAMDPLADPALADDDDIEFLTLDKVKVERLEPSLTARIDGVEMDFWSVIIRGDSHLVGSPSLLSPSLDMPRCFVGNAGIKGNPMSLREWVEWRPARTLSSLEDKAVDDVAMPACRALDE